MAVTKFPFGFLHSAHCNHALPYAFQDNLIVFTLTPTPVQPPILVTVDLTDNDNQWVYDSFTLTVTVTDIEHSSKVPQKPLRIGICIGAVIENPSAVADIHWIFLGALWTRFFKISCFFQKYWSEYRVSAPFLQVGLPFTYGNSWMRPYSVDVGRHVG